LESYSSILQQLDETENIWTSSYDSSQTSISSFGVHAYQENFQMHLSASILTFLLRASQAGSSLQQHTHFTATQERCIADFRATATRILNAQGTSHSTGYSPDDRFSFGWGDAVMIYGSLRTIALSPISLDWQRDAANRVGATIKERLGFQLLL
jgi:hypothetical protein